MMQNFLKFGVRCDNDSTLIKVDESLSLPEILGIAIAKLKLPESNPADYCFILFSEVDESATYITEENRNLLANDVVHLVKNPSVATDLAINSLRFELQILNWDNSQCLRLYGVLTELSALMRCPQFAIEFVKAEGLDVVFQLLECFEHVETTQQEPPVWPALMTCLAQLSEYGISGTDDQLGDITKGKGSTTTQDVRSKENDRANPNVPSMMFTQTFNELFSWHLVSEKFVAVLAKKCMSETNMDTMKNELKILLKLLTHCSNCAETVAVHTGPEFVYSRLKVAHNALCSETDQMEYVFLTPTSPQNVNNPEDRLAGCSTSGTERTVPNEIACLPDWVMNPLRNELMCSLLGCMYALLYHAYRSGSLASVLPTYLNSHTLPELISYFPQIKVRPHQIIRLVNTSDSSRRQMTSKFGTEHGTNPIGSGRDNSFRGGSNFYFQLAPSRNQGATKTENESSNFMAPLSILYGLQKLQLALLAEELMTNACQENATVADQIRSLLLQACGGDRNYLLKIAEQLSPLEPGFEFRQQPFSRLHFNCLRAFAIAKPGIVPLILSYGCDPKTCSTEPGSPRRTQFNKFSNWRTSPDGASRYFTDDSVLQSPSLLLAGRRRKSTNFARMSGPGDPSQKLRFPLLQVVSSLNRLLCKLLNVTDRVEPLCLADLQRKQIDLHSFCPLLFDTRASGMNAFEDIFVRSMCVLFDIWTHLNACSQDVEDVLLVLREQLSFALKQNPLSAEDFEQLVRQYNLQSVLSDWKRKDQTTRDEMYKTHPVLKDLNDQLRKIHRSHVQEQRINAMMYSAPLEYTPQKSPKQPSRDNIKYQVYLSTDRNSLVLMDQKKCTHGLWPLTCIERVSTGIEERVKKNAERTIVLRITIRENNEPDEWGSNPSPQCGKSHTMQSILVARNDAEYNYWWDGLYILHLIHSPSKQFAEDIQFLTALDMELRVSGLDLSSLPTKSRPIPADPPEFDFPEP